jgi:hypothetical protein
LELIVVKRLFLLKIILLFPYFGFADNWTVLRTNKPEYTMGFILQETDIIDIQEGEFLIIGNGKAGRRQIAVIITPGEKTVWHGIEEAKKLEYERKKALDRNRNRLGEPTYLFLLYPDYLPYWIQE